MTEGTLCHSGSDKSRKTCFWGSPEQVGLELSHVTSSLIWWMYIWARSFNWSKQSGITFREFNESVQSQVVLCWALFLEQIMDRRRFVSFLASSRTARVNHRVTAQWCHPRPRNSENQAGWSSPTADNHLFLSSATFSSSSDSLARSVAQTLSTMAVLSLSSEMSPATSAHALRPFPGTGPSIWPSLEIKKKPGAPLFQHLMKCSI